MTDARIAWEPYRPTAENPWDSRKAGHLYRRAAFGATWDELQTAVAAGPEQAVARLFNERAAAAFEAETQPLADSIKRVNNGLQLRAWWLYRMLYTPAPLREKLTLFWHNHFATSNAKVNNAGFMLGQYELMHRHALGDFRAMLTGMSADPAMLIWLDGQTNEKGKPNENYARELMELFSLGIGNYSEADIREAARALTGWSIKEGRGVFDKARFDDGTKTVFGKTGPFGADDIVRLCLEKPACPTFLVSKLVRFLVSETIPLMPELLAPLIEQYRVDFDTGKLVRRILLSNLFYSPEAYRSRIKSPVDFALGIVRALEGRIGTTALAVALEGLGQNVFNPPSVKGWDGGPAWLNGQTLLQRQNLALALTSTTDPRFGRRTDPAALLARHEKREDGALVDFLLDLFLQGDAPADTRPKLLDYLTRARQAKSPPYWTADDAAAHRVRAVSHLILTMPEYQLS